MSGVRDKKDRLIIFMFLGLVILFFSQVLFTKATYIFRDIYHTFYPTRYFVAECIKEGIFPLWNPYLFFGFPFFGSLQHGMLNPLSIFMYILPFNIGFKLFIVAHFYLAGIFMYILMRDWKVSRVSSLIAALTYTFNGYLLSIDIFTHLTSACWTPLIFLFYNKAIDSFKFKYVIFTSIFLSLQFLGEKTMILYATIIALILFTIGKGILQYKEGIKSIRGIFIFILVGLISIGLVLVQLLPFLEAISYSYRQGGMVYHKATKWSLPPLELFTLICPSSSGFVEFIWKFWGQDFFKSIYFGIIGIFLAFIALFEKRRRNLFWAGIFFGFIILALGGNTIFYKFLYTYIPGFSYERYPVKFFCMSIFAGSILAGFGFDYLLRIIRENRIKPLIFLFVSNILLLIILLFWYINLGKIFFLLKVNFFTPTIIEGLISIEGNYFMLFKNFFLVTTLFSIFNLLIIITKKLKYNLCIFFISSVIIIIFDLFFFGLNLNPLISEEFYSKKPPILKVLKKDPTDISRFIIEPQSLKELRYVRNYTLFELQTRRKLLIKPNLGLIHKVFTSDGYGFLVLKDYFKFNTKLTSGNFSNVQKLLNLSNIKYVVSKFELPIKDLKLVYSGKGYGEKFIVYENPTCFMRAFFVQKVRIVKDRQKILDLLTTKDFDPKKEVILEEEIQSKMQNTTTYKRLSQIQNIKIIDYQPNWVTINTSCSHNGFLFLSDTYYPGWQAYVDGKQTKIYRANFFFRAILLPKGSHKVEFVYSPLSFKIGLCGTLTTIISIFIAIIVKKVSVRDGLF